MAYQIINSFDEAVGGNVTQYSGPENGQVYGWEYIAMGTMNASSYSATGFANGAVAFNSIGNSVYLTNSVASNTPGSGQRFRRSVTDNNLLTMGFAFRMQDGENPTSSAHYNGYRYGFRSAGGDTIHFAPVRPGAAGTPWFAGLYINGTLSVTGVTNISTSTPWVYIEISLNKTTGLATLRVSEITEGTAALPGGWAAADAELCHLNIPNASQTSSLQLLIDDLVVYDTYSPRGICKVYGYTKTGDALATFTDGSDLGQATTTSINTCSNTVWRACATSGGEDRFSYSNILPTGIQAANIYAVRQVIMCSAGSWVTPSLQAILRDSGGTSRTTTVTGIKPFTMTRFESTIYETDPATSAAWTRAGAQAIQTGYKVP